MTSFKLANTVKTIEIAGKPYRAGKLTLGAALSIEEHLAKLPTPYETLENSKALSQVSKELADTLISKALADTMFWPPDAISALTNPKFLTRADFGIAFISAILAAYNPHLSPQEIEAVAKSASSEDVLKMQLVAFGADNDPKEPPANAGTETNQANSSSESTGLESSHGL